VTEWRRLDAPNFVVRRQCQSCGLPAAERRDNRQLTSAAKRRLCGNTINRNFPMNLRSCSILLLGHIVTKLGLGNVFVVCFFIVVVGTQGTEERAEVNG
jgi:hypothetical protein